MRLDRIVIAVDFTVDSTAAVTWIARYFAPKASLLLVHAVNIHDASPLRGEREAEIEARRETECVGATARLETTADWLNTTDVRTIVTVGDPANVVREAVRTWGAELLVVGRHGARPGLWDFLGSTVDTLLGHSDVPVLVASGMRDAPPSRVLVAAEHGISDAVGTWVRLLYDTFTPRITVFHSVSAAVPTHLLAVPSGLDGLSSGAVLFEQTQADADRWVAALAKHGIPKEAIDSEVSLGEPGSEIVAAADRLHADLIVVERPSDGGLRRALFGSVTRDVIRHARHPVLVVQHTGDEHAPDGRVATSST